MVFCCHTHFRNGLARVAPAALSLVATTFPEGPARNRALGAYGAVSSLGFVAGPVLGGILVQFTSWRAVFLVNVPVGLIAVLVAPHVLAQSRSKQASRRLDVGGAMLVTVAIALTVYAVSEAGLAGLGSTRVLGALGLAVVAGSGSASLSTAAPTPWCRSHCCGGRA
jgi:MFS family permease